MHDKLPFANSLIALFKHSECIAICPPILSESHLPISISCNDSVPFLYWQCRLFEEKLSPKDLPMPRHLAQPRDARILHRHAHIQPARDGTADQRLPLLLQQGDEPLLLGK